MRVGVDADRGDVQLAARGAFVQRLDVLEDVLELPAARVDLVLGERVKHERIVGIGRVAQGEAALFQREISTSLSEVTRVICATLIRSTGSPWAATYSVCPVGVSIAKSTCGIWNDFPSE